MKKFTLAFLVILVAGFTNAQQPALRPININIEGKETRLYNQSYALVIGISEYISAWPDLPGVKKDVLAVKNALEKNGFNVTLLENLTKEQMDRAFNDFIGKYGQNFENRLLFYFAGHGYTIKTTYGDELGYIVPSDAPLPYNNTGNFQSKAIEMQQIEIYARRIQSKHALFLFDACFSGSLFALTRAAPEIISYKTSQPVRQFITSGSADEKVPDVSIFCKQFISAITTNDADANKDGYVTGSELGDFLQTTVVNYSYNSQHPQYGKIRNPNLDKGDFVFVLNPQQNYPVTEQPVAYAKPVVTEKTVVYYGSIELSSEINGSLFLDGEFIKDISGASASTVKVINITNVKIGSHSLEIKGSENWSQNINVSRDQTASVTAKTKQPVSIGGKYAGEEYTETAFGLNIEMVKVEGGTFMMGSPENEPNRDSDETQHRVTLSSFWIGKYEVTFEQYDKFCEATGRSKPDDIGWGRGRRPVTNVSWYDATAFCEWLSSVTGRTYRLPTEAEWEYAAKGGNRSRGFIYAGDNSIQEVAWYIDNSGGQTHPVGGKRPNELGLYDMSGNVWEWCSDWYGKYSSSPQVNPSGPSGGSNRVIRGGSWFNLAIGCRAANRNSITPDSRRSLLGFRLVSPE